MHNITPPQQQQQHDAQWSQPKCTPGGEIRRGEIRDNERGEPTTNQ